MLQFQNLIQSKTNKVQKKLKHAYVSRVP